MYRRTLICMAATGLLIASLGAHAQHPGRRFRIGGFTSSSPDVQAVFIREFERGLRELGYADGGNAVFEYRWLRGEPDQLPGLAADLVRWPADVIVVGVNAAVAIAQRATSTIPIVMFLSADPVQNGFVASLAKPGGNITGLHYFAGDEMQGKVLQTLKEIIPGLSAVGVLAEPGYGTDRAALRDAARQLGLRLEEVEIRGNGVADAFAAMTSRRVGGFIPVGGALTYGRRQQIAGLALESRLPGIHFVGDSARSGLLAAYGPSLLDMYRRSAGYVDKIYKGARPADLPVEQPTKFELVINLKTAKALGLTIPQSLLLRADEVIQ